MNKSRWTSITLVGISTLALALIFGLQSGGKSEQQRQDELRALKLEVQQLKDEVKETKTQNTPTKTTTPTIFNKQTLQNIKDKSSQLVNEAKTISDDLISGDHTGILSNIQALENALDALGNFPHIANITQRFAAFSATTGGQNLLEKSTQDLSAVMSRLQNPSDADIENALAQAKNVSPALTQSFENVPADDLKAAAMLLTMTQLRTSLNRDGQPFADDLALLQKLTRNSSPELQASLDRLAPHAQNGVLTSAGLSNELRGLTGEIVVASLKGEDLSIADRAKARVNSVLLLNDQGSGSSAANNATQATLNAAENKLQSGDIQGAILDMQTLNGPAAQVAQPWIEQAQASLMARNLKTTLAGVLDTKAAGLKSYGASQKMNNNGCALFSCVRNKNNKHGLCPQHKSSAII